MPCATTSSSGGSASSARKCARRGAGKHAAGRCAMRSILFLFLAAVVPGAAAEPVPHAPTPEDAVPDAILGKAPPLRGRSVQYYPDHPATVGYLAEPAGEGPHGAVI